MSTAGNAPDVARVTAGGVTYPVVVPKHATDYIQGRLYDLGEPYEPAMLNAMASMLARDDLVLDIGANIGNHTLYLAHVVGARVVSFEPSRELADALVQSTRLGGVSDRVDVRACALGAEEHRGRLGNLDESNLGTQTMSVDDAAGDVEIHVLDALDLDGPVRAMKIDVEGMEMDVLAGASNLVARDRPLIFIEAIDREMFDLVATWMTEHDYCYQATFNVTPTHFFKPGTPEETTAGRPALEVVRACYDLRAESAELRRQLHETSLKYRRATGARTNAKNRQAERVARLERRIQRLQLELEEARRPSPAPWSRVVRRLRRGRSSDLAD